MEKEKRDPSEEVEILLRFGHYSNIIRLRDVSISYERYIPMCTFTSVLYVDEKHDSKM
jgi:hypothetical protein